MLVAVAVTTGADGGLTVMFTVAGAEVPPEFVAVTEKLAVWVVATVGAVQVTWAAFGGLGVKVPGVLAVSWVQANEVGLPVAVADRVTV